MSAIVTPKLITARVIQKPTYVAAEGFAAWQRKNLPALLSYWEELDDEPGSSFEFSDFAKSQYDVFCATAEEEEDEAVSPRRFRSADEAAAYEAGVPARGPL